MKKAIVILFVTVSSATGFAQEKSIIADNNSDNKISYVRYKLVINPVELLVKNISVAAERVFEQHTLGVTLAFKPATQNKGEINTATGMFGDYSCDNAINRAYNALSAGVNSKRYFHPQRRKNIYLDGQFLYRYWWFNNKTVSYPNVEGYRFEATRTEKMNVYDGKILFGYSLIGRKEKRTKTVVDFFGGIDVRYKAWQYQTYNGTVNGNYYAYLKEIGSSWIGNPYIGMQLGLGQ